MLVRIIIWPLFFFFSIPFLQAQEQLGLRLGNYAGINSVILNPSNNLTSPFAWDINFVAAGIHVDNDYAFIKKVGLSKFLKNTNNIRLATEINESQLQADEILLDYFDKNRKMFGLAQVDVMGPSLMINIKGRYSVGIFTRARAMVSTQNIPAAYRYYQFDRTPYFENIKTNKVTVAGMAWSEIGLNLATKVETYNGDISVGFNLKYLQGYEGIYLRNNSALTLAQLPGDSLQFVNTNLEAGFTSINFDNYETANKKGTGFAVDFGLQFIADSNEDEYTYKVGIALLDIGKIKFSKDAQKYGLRTDSTFMIPFGTYGDVSSTDDFIQRFSFDALRDSSATVKGNEFSMWMPGAISLQMDYAIMPNVFVNALLIQRLPFAQAAIARGNILAVTPRYSHRWYEASLPIVLYNYKHLRVGAAIRLAYLIIGTDNLGGFFKTSKFTGADFYVGLKFNPFNMQGFGNNGGGSRSRGKNVKCYEF